MFKQPLCAALSGLIALWVNVTIAHSQEIEVVVALPAPTLTFSSAFLAEDAGFYKQEGLKVTHRNLVGVASVNAVIAGSADFTIGTGPVFLRAAAQGQRLLAIANLIDRPLVEMVMRKDVAAAAGITEKSPFIERAKALKGKTVAIQGVGSIVHAWQRLATSRAGLDVEKDVRIAPMDPPGMLAGLQTKALDGFATSLPFTYGLVQTKPETCQQQREKCVRIARAYAASNRFIREKPAEALEFLRKRFDKMDPALLAAAWEVVRRAHAADIRIPVAGLANSEKVSLEAKLLKPEDALKSYDGLHTDEFVR